MEKIINDSPIVFTITDLGNRNYRISTKDPRGKELGKEKTQVLFPCMRTISEMLNNKGYAVLFELG